MRILILNLLATALVLLFGATSASAVAINMSVRDSSAPLGSLAVSDTVTVDVFADLDLTGIQLFTTSVIVTDASAASYDAAASAALPIIYPAPAPAYGTQGDQPGYILYAPSTGIGMPPPPSTFLAPQQTPWQEWVNPPVGAQQINVNYADLNGTTNPGATNIWIASMVFHIDDVTADFQIELGPTMVIGPMILQTLADGQLDTSLIPVSDPITLTGINYTPVPEPTTAALIGLGLLGLAISGRRNS